MTFSEKKTIFSGDFDCLMAYQQNDDFLEYMDEFFQQTGISEIAHKCSNF